MMILFSKILFYLYLLFFLCYFLLRQLRRVVMSANVLLILEDVLLFILYFIFWRYNWNEGFCSHERPKGRAYVQSVAASFVVLMTELFVWISAALQFLLQDGISLLEVFFSYMFISSSLLKSARSLRNFILL